MTERITEKEYPIEARWILKSIIRSLVVFVAVAVFFLFVGRTGNGLSVWDVLSEDPLLTIYFWLYVAFIPGNMIFALLRRATFHYALELQFLTLRQGILSKQERHIPYGVIQNIFVKQDLFDRIFGLASLTIENASQGAGALAAPQEQKIFGLRVGNQGRSQTEMVGFSGNKVSIPGLTKANAEILKGIILQKIKENPIEDSQSGL